MESEVDLCPLAPSTTQDSIETRSRSSKQNKTSDTIWRQARRQSSRWRAVCLQPIGRFKGIQLTTALPLLFQVYAILMVCAHALPMAADYIIVGAGTTGLLLANRLSSDPSISVLLIDPGADERNNSNVTSIFDWQRNQGTKIDWAYHSAPQPGADNRTLTYHAGNIVGGTSLINGMNYIRADAAVIDAWESLGATDWNWESLWPYYKSTEHFITPTLAQAEAGAQFNPEFHGRTGDLQVGYPFELVNGTMRDIVAAAWKTLGIPINADANGGNINGFTVRPLMVNRDASVRESAATAFYYPVDDRPNLKLLRGTVTSLLLNDSGEGVQRADAVRYTEGGLTQTVSVNPHGEVILAAGALRTPLILEASGIGDPEILSNLGIDVSVNLPGVGRNLQDQPNFSLTFEAKVNFTGLTPYATFATAKQIFGDDVTAVAAETSASISKWAQQLASVGTAVSADAMEQILRIQHDLMFRENVSIAEIVTSRSAGKFASSTWPLLPFSRGSVHLNSDGSPAINPNFFKIDFDMTYHVAIGNITRLFWTKDPVSAIIQRLLIPEEKELPLNGTDVQWTSFIRKNIVSNNHPVGTAAMMSRDLGGVINAELKVYGTTNIRVVDAAAIPLQTNGHLVSTLYAMAEKASRIVRGSNKQFICIPKDQTCL